MMLSEQEVVQRVSGVSLVRLRRWVARGWIVPSASAGTVIFTELDLARCELIRQFRDELEIEPETVPVVLSLLDQIHGLRRQLRNVMKAIDQEPEELRRRIKISLGRMNTDMEGNK